MAQRKSIPGKFVWFQHVSTGGEKEQKRAEGFYGEVLGWRIQGVPMAQGSYDMIFTGPSVDSMIGGFAPARGAQQSSHWASYASVDDVDAAAKAAAEQGGKVLQPPFDIPGVGRMAAIADPLGAAIHVFKSITDDPADGDTPLGGWVWNELHTTDTSKALAFYEKVLGWSHRSMNMGPAGTYHIVSRDGVDRGGVTSHLMPGMSPHWLPYVRVKDPDATAARAQKHGGSIPFGPEDIPGVGRFASIQDPSGAVLAILNPIPPAK